MEIIYRRMERIYGQAGSASWVGRRQISIDTYSIYSDTYGVMDASIEVGAWAKTGEKYKKSGFCLALSSFYIIFAKIRFTPLNNDTSIIT